MPIISRISAILGSAITDITCIFQSGLSSTTGRPLVSSRICPAAVVTDRPSICDSRSSTSLATTSMTRSFRAADAVSVAASRTAFSPQSALRPLSSASVRM